MYITLLIDQSRGDDSPSTVGGKVSVSCPISSSAGFAFKDK